MDKEYKAMQYNPQGTYNIRYCIVSTETGEVLDDTQGYGYKTAQKAYAAYAYKTRDKSKDKEKEAKREKIRKWMTGNTMRRLTSRCPKEVGN